MSNPFDEIKAAVRAAEWQLQAADQTAQDMAKLLKGRLRRVSKTYAGIETLKALKKELRDFDMVTGTWREPKP